MEKIIFNDLFSKLDIQIYFGADAAHNVVTPQS